MTKARMLSSLSTHDLNNNWWKCVLKSVYIFLPLTTYRLLISRLGLNTNIWIQFTTHMSSICIKLFRYWLTNNTRPKLLDLGSWNLACMFFRKCKVPLRDDFPKFLQEQKNQESPIYAWSCWQINIELNNDR